MKKRNNSWIVVLFALFLLPPIQITAQVQNEEEANPEYSPTILLQIGLHHAGYNPGVIDGKIGPSTRSAIRRFQADFGLKVDGVPGPETYSKLYSVLSNPADETLVRASGSQYNQTRSISPARTQYSNKYLVDEKGRLVPRVAENRSYYGEISKNTGRPKTVYVGGYYRKDGTYVRGHYRSKPRWR